MKNVLRAALTLAVAWSLNVCYAETVGRVVGVMDGDTIKVLTPAQELIRVRLSGIDAPEKKQAFGAVAKKALSDLAFERNVVLVGEKKDRYGRLIAKVLSSGNDVNLSMVKQGLAWHYKKYEREQNAGDRYQYAQAEEHARIAKVGLWSERAPVAPWDFRKSRRLSSSE